MQPDLLSPEKEENTPEPISPEVQPSELSAADEVAEAGPAPGVEKKRSKLSLAYIGLGVLVLLLIAAFAWVGYWAYSLSTELTTTQKQLAALQTDHARLQTDSATLKSKNETLNAELTQAREDLEKANTELAASQEAASKSRDENKQLATQIDKAGRLAQVLLTFTTIEAEADFLVLAEQIDDADDDGLSKAWSNVTTFPTEESFSEFLEYLILAIRDSLR